MRLLQCFTGWTLKIELTKPSLHRYIAHGNLTALRRFLEKDRARIDLPKTQIRQHLAGAYAWVATQELLSHDGSRAKAIALFGSSLYYNPFQKRTLILLLASLFIPRRLFAVTRSIKQRLEIARNLFLHAPRR